MTSLPATRGNPRTEAWFRELDGDRLEIFLKVEGGLKVRASGPTEHMNDLVDWFEEKSGLEVRTGVTTWRRPRTGPKPMAGQTDLMTELSSDATLS